MSCAPVSALMIPRPSEQRRLHFYDQPHNHWIHDNAGWHSNAKRSHDYCVWESTQSEPTDTRFQFSNASLAIRNLAPVLFFLSHLAHLSLCMPIFCVCAEKNIIRASYPSPKLVSATKDRPSATFNAKTTTIRVARKSRITAVRGARANGSTLTTAPCPRARGMSGW
jgi:hypothetical protein